MKQSAVRFGIVIFGLFVGALAYESAHHPADPPELVRAKLSVAREFAEKTVTSMGSSERWDGISIDEATPKSYAFTIHYRIAPKAVDIATDVKGVGQALLLQLTLGGRRASDDGTAIVIRARNSDGGTLPGVARFDARRDGMDFAPE